MGTEVIAFLLALVTVAVIELPNVPHYTWEYLCLSLKR